MRGKGKWLLVCFIGHDISTFIIIIIIIVGGGVHYSVGCLLLCIVRVVFISLFSCNSAFILPLSLIHNFLADFLLLKFTFSL